MSQEPHAAFDFASELRVPPHLTAVVDQMNAHRWLFLTSIHDAHNTLVLRVTEGQAGPPIPRGVRGNPIATDAACAEYEIRVPHYLAYQVLNETCYTRRAKWELYSGGAFGVYSRSRYLEYYGVRGATETINERTYPCHYALHCMHHVIDILGWSPMLTLGEAEHPIEITVIRESTPSPS